MTPHRNIVARRPVFPVRRIATVWHWGSPTPPTRRPASSMECWHLSVTAHPWAWLGIAKLGGSPLYALHRADGTRGVFVDMRSLPQERREALLQSVRDLVTPTTVYVHSRWDEELEETVENLYRTHKEAAFEHEGERGVIEARRGWAPTRALQVLWKRHFIGRLDPYSVQDCALLAAIERTARFDGAWWTDRLDSVNYSAPRGAIFQSRVREWAWRGPLPETACPDFGADW